MSTTVDVRHVEDQMAKLRVRAESLEVEIDELSKLEHPTPGQTNRFEDAMRAAEKITNEHVQSGDGARVVDVPGSSKAAMKFEFMRRGGDPWERDFRMQSPDELRDRAL